MALSLERYFGEDVEDARAALQEILRITREYENKGSKGISFEATYASVYSRLYRLERQQGREDVARKHYELAIEHWKNVFAERGADNPSPEQLKQQIEQVDEELGTPAWKVVDRRP